MNYTHANRGMGKDAYATIMPYIKCVQFTQMSESRITIATA